jgi:ribosome modulation factor
MNFPRMPRGQTNELYASDRENLLRRGTTQGPQNGPNGKSRENAPGPENGGAIIWVKGNGMNLRT